MKTRSKIKALVMSAGFGWMATGGCLPDNFYSDLWGGLISSAVLTTADTIIVSQIVDTVDGDGE